MKPGTVSETGQARRDASLPRGCRRTSWVCSHARRLRTLAPGSAALASHPPAVYLREDKLREFIPPVEPVDGADLIFLKFNRILGILRKFQSGLRPVAGPILPLYLLSRENRVTGTMPQLGGVRKCSQKAKGAPRICGAPTRSATAPISTRSASTSTSAPGSRATPPARWAATHPRRTRSTNGAGRGRTASTTGTANLARATRPVCGAPGRGYRARHRRVRLPGARPVFRVVGPGKSLITRLQRHRVTEPISRTHPATRPVRSGLRGRSSPAPSSRSRWPNDATPRTSWWSGTSGPCRGPPAVRSSGRSRCP